MKAVCVQSFHCLKTFDSGPSTLDSRGTIRLTNCTCAAILNSRSAAVNNFNKGKSDGEIRSRLWRGKSVSFFEGQVQARLYVAYGFCSEGNRSMRDSRHRKPDDSPRFETEEVLRICSGKQLWP